MSPLMIKVRPPTVITEMIIRVVWDLRFMVERTHIKVPMDSREWVWEPMAGGNFQMSAVMVFGEFWNPREMFLPHMYRRQTNRRPTPMNEGYWLVRATRCKYKV